ncbi:hypothetical protein QYE76_010368 [Lolium multiflorum]|uniref:Reverse transcriptase/retrotransposon-derived protein RNase H-like domain-containing protein n=1 Tax=Lolium multiflorum TaxID=4521 RepID=A0AAD8TUU4_LOLMU|nr:hypothetical protein QYE76_010368 [Lolium multiflorum]
MPRWFIPAYFKKTQASKLGDAQGIPFFIDNIIRNPSKEIFSELDEINAQGPIFTRSFQKSEEETKWGHEVATHQAARLALGRAALLWALVTPLTYPSAYLKPPSRNPPYREPRYGKPSRDAAIANPISRGFGRSPARRRGESSPEGLYIIMPASGLMRELLGFLVSARGIEANPEKIQAIVTMRKPTKLKEIQRNRRVAALSRFVARLGKRALPFYALIKQGEKFEWNEEAERAFEDLKRTISTPPILVAPKEKEPLLLYIAATPQVVSTVVEREEEGKLHGVQRPYTSS